MEALEDLLRRDWEQEVWRSYVAGLLWRIDGAWGGKNVPKYEALIDIDKEGEITPEQALEKRRKMIDELNAGGGEKD